MHLTHTGQNIQQFLNEEIEINFFQTIQKFLTLNK
jgi:hypothetical protein